MPISRSFQIHMNWKIANEASAGTDRGSTRREEHGEVAGPIDACRLDHLLRQREMKFLRMKMQNGSPKHVCAIQTAATVLLRWRYGKDRHVFRCGPHR